jgi:hypothetical protein
LLVEDSLTLEVVVYADDVHEVAINRQDRDAKIGAWFKQNLRQ